MPPQPPRFRLRFKPDPAQKDAQQFVRRLVHDQLTPAKTFTASTFKLFNRARFAALAAQQFIVDPAMVSRARWVYRCRPFGGFAQLVDLQHRKATMLSQSCKVAKWCPHCYGRRLAVIRTVMLATNAAGYATIGADMDCTHLTWLQRRPFILEQRRAFRATLRLLGHSESLVGILLRPTEAGHCWLRLVAVIPTSNPVAYIVDPGGSGVSRAPRFTTDLADAMAEFSYPATHLQRWFIKKGLTEFLECTHQIPEAIVP